MPRAKSNLPCRRRHPQPRARTGDDPRSGAAQPLDFCWRWPGISGRARRTCREPAVNPAERATSGARSADTGVASFPAARVTVHEHGSLQDLDRRLALVEGRLRQHHDRRFYVQERQSVSGEGLDGLVRSQRAERHGNRPEHPDDLRNRAGTRDEIDRAFQHGLHSFAGEVFGLPHHRLSDRLVKHDHVPADRDRHRGGGHRVYASARAWPRRQAGVPLGAARDRAGRLRRRCPDNSMIAVDGAWPK
jgi:hypothetical protein